MRRVAVLRPEPGASATVDRARAHGLDAFAVPLFEIEPLGWEAPDAARFDGLLLTSANAVRNAGPGLEDLRWLPVYTVGAATAEAVREAGFDINATGDGGVDELLGSIEVDVELLHLCGEDRREPTEAQQRITSIPVYRARTIDDPDLGGVQGSIAVIHSPRAGRRFAELVPEKTKIAIAAISPAAAEAAGSGWQAVEVAESPSDEALLALAARLCNNSPPE
jgi:uroporphyrinogen-III synthase